jgi:hypothetical protein
MKFLRIKIAVIMIFTFASVVTAQTTDADIPKLMRESELNLKKSEGVYNYTFTQKKTFRSVNKKGEVTKEEVEIAEAYPTPNRQNLILIKISENGVQLTAKEIAKRRQRAAKELEEAERKPEKKQNPDPDEDKYLRLSIEDILRAAEFHSPRRVRFRDQDALVLDFRPRADFRPTTRMEGVILNLIGSIWIDAEKKEIMRLEAYPSDAGYKASSKPMGIIHPDAAFVVERKPLSEGIWIVTLWHLDTVSRPALFNKVPINSTIEFSQYKRFEANIETFEINKPSSKP